MQGGARDQDMVHLLHCLFVFSMHFNFTLSSAHMEGAKNSIADVISRTQTGYPSAGGSGSVLNKKRGLPAPP